MLLRRCAQVAPLGMSPILISENCLVPFGAEVYEPVVTGVDEERAWIARCVGLSFVIGAGLTVSRVCNPDGQSSWVVVTDKGDTQGDICP